MSIHYDADGKLFTSVVTKDPAPVIIHTLLHRIEGILYIRPNDRIWDTLKTDDLFIPLKDVSVINTQGKKILSSDFLLVNRDQIIWMLPLEKKV